MSAAFVTHWVANWVIGQSFLGAVDRLGLAAVYLLFGAVVRGERGGGARCRSRPARPRKRPKHICPCAPASFPFHRALLTSQP